MTWDCVVVGAGASGLSAALVLGRARQRTPSVAPAIAAGASAATAIVRGMAVSR